MSRKILFRGKRIDNREWIEGGYAENDGKAFIVMRTRYIPDTRDWDTAEYYENNPCYHLTMIEVDPETVCQHTGLTDKNGKKIFERDICSDGKNIVRIVWSDHHQWGVEILTKSGLNKGLVFPLWQYDNCEMNGYRELEVAGNLWDTPELLNQ